MNKEIVKICKKHGDLTKEETYFHKTTCTTGGHYVCKFCKSEYFERNRAKLTKRTSDFIKKDREINKEKYASRQRKYQKKYRKLITSKTIIRKLNISLDHYEHMFVDQDNKCYICKKEETKISHRSGKVARLSLDHCHKTMKVRKLLCHNCNIMIGASKDSIETLLNAVNYLKEF